MRSTRSSPQKIAHTPKSKSLIYPEYHNLANELNKFSGKRDYLEWENEMDEWFYDNHIPREKILSYALRKLTGDAYRWWLQEVDERWYNKEPNITSWRELKKLLRNKYAPQALERAPKANSKTQGLAVQEKKAVVVPNQKKTSTPVEAKTQADLFEELTKNFKNQKMEAKSTSQPKKVPEQIVVHKQSRQLSIKSSGEPKQCKSSIVSKSRGVTCYNCRKKGHLVATCPEKLELTNTSLESKLSSPNSSSEVICRGLENSSSCVMHLFLSKNVDSGHTSKHENDKTGEAIKERPICLEKEMSFQKPEPKQLLPICKEFMMLQESDVNNIKENMEIQLHLAVQDQENVTRKEEQTENKTMEQLALPREFLKANCDIPFIQSNVASEKTCGKLTSLEPEQASSVVCFSQVQEKETSETTQRSWPLSNNMDHTSFVPKPVPIPFPCDYTRNHCKEIDMVRKYPNLFVLISAQDEKRFGLENAKEFCVSKTAFDKIIPTFETLTLEMLFEPKGFLFDEFFELNSSLRDSLCSNEIEMFRTKTENV
ncbi:uncharacterized protein LOC111829471 [Capsella rubella]|uniref:uncharacterized protein LOC111829471 n=1 Tax=Capsella rubella TaxID=81985 RepID=UPI000CD5537E|nr:uncharacterized protein LOC111829471 [Capsella rubella]